MDYEWDENKNKTNIRNHGVRFQAAEDFDWENALVAQDYRKDYGEDRFVATGRIGGRLHVMAFTVRGAKVRIISLRKANPREIKNYD